MATQQLDLPNQRLAERLPGHGVLEGVLREGHDTIASDSVTAWSARKRPTYGKGRTVLRLPSAAGHMHNPLQQDHAPPATTNREQPGYGRRPRSA